MRISGMNNVDHVYKTKKANKAYQTQSLESSKDVVTLSSFAKELSIAKKAVMQAPEVRMDKVESIKAQLEAGTYNISATHVADKMLERAREL